MYFTAAFLIMRLYNHPIGSKPLIYLKGLRFDIQSRTLTSTIFGSSLRFSNPDMGIYRCQLYVYLSAPRLLYLVSHFLALQMKLARSLTGLY